MCENIIKLFKSSLLVSCSTANLEHGFSVLMLLVIKVQRNLTLKNQSINAISSQWTWSNHKWNLGIIGLYWLKCLGSPNKTLSCEVSALKVSKTVQHDKNVLGGFKDYYSNLAGKLSKKLPKPPNKFTLNTVFQHYKGIIQSDSFNLATVSENTILTILKNTNVFYLVVF